MNFAAIGIAGILVGLLGGYVLRQKIYGMLGCLLLGLAGAFVGGFFFGDNISITSSIFTNVLITSTIGAIIFIAAIGLFKRTETRDTQV